MLMPKMTLSFPDVLVLSFVRFVSTSLSSAYLGPYRLLNIVNTGQTSRLWQSYDDHERKYIGIKTLQERFVRDPEQIRFLRHEYEVAGPLDHPLLIKIHKYGVDKKVPYLAMEWCSAPNLKMHLNRSYEQVAQYLQKIVPQMVEAMVYLHAQGWIHRDIKPDNYIYSDETGLKLIDFALAQKKPNFLSKMLAFGSKVQGTASYMSPEQIQGKPADEPSDIYSLGCTFFELIAGRPPFTGGTINDLLQKHISAAVPPLTARNTNVTPEMTEIVRMCLSKDAKDRPQTSQELYDLTKSVRVFKKPPKNSDVN